MLKQVRIVAQRFGNISKYMIIASNIQPIRKCERYVTQTKGSFLACAFAPDGKICAAGNSDGSVKVRFLFQISKQDSNVLDRIY